MHSLSLSCSKKVKTSIIKVCCLMITLCEEQTLVRIWIGPHALSLYRKEQLGHVSIKKIVSKKKVNWVWNNLRVSKWIFTFVWQVAGSRRQALVLLHIGYWMNIGYRPVFLVLHPAGGIARSVLSDGTLGLEYAPSALSLTASLSLTLSYWSKSNTQIGGWGGERTRDR